jgi:hypothetical protein
MDVVHDTYAALTDAIRASLADHGFETTSDHHHGQPTGSKYRLFTRDDRALCLSWDSTGQLFRLECCQRHEGAPTGAWAIVCEEHLDPATADTGAIDRIVTRVRDRLTSYLEASSV